MLIKKQLKRPAITKAMKPRSAQSRLGKQKSTLTFNTANNTKENRDE
ncbi:hypothetical protein [Evansella cellulosilytica]|nr:hypothetical protein [Evansella cellulosilytica]